MSDLEKRLINFYSAYIKQYNAGNLCIVWHDTDLNINKVIQSGRLMDELSLFGKSDLTIGVNIHDYREFTQKQLDVQIDHHSNSLTSLSSVSLDSLKIPNIFNLLGRTYDNNTMIPITAYRIAYNMSYAINILNKIPLSKRKVVVELGGGFGYGAFFLTSNSTNTCYIIVDIPSTAVISAYFLIKLGKKVCLFGEFDKWDNNLVNLYDIIILNTKGIELLDTNFVDVMINTASLTEMSTEYIDYYISHISRICKNFYYDNHTILNYNQVDLHLKEKMKDFTLVFNRETPINYREKLWQYCFPFYERLYTKMLLFR